MVDILSKKVFIFDLDDTLINTSEANNLALRRAYKKLASECEEDLSCTLPREDFEAQLRKIYRESKNPDGTRKFYDYTAGVFEEYCNNVLPSKGLKLAHTDFSLAARLYWYFRETKYAALMPKPHAFDVINHLRKLGPVYCVTEGSCNYQHTKAMITDLEPKLQNVIVTTKKEEELKMFVEQKKFPKEQTIMIGDRASDILAGKLAGIETLYIPAENPDRPKEDFSRAVPDLELKSLKDLLARLNTKA